MKDKNLGIFPSSPDNRVQAIEPETAAENLEEGVFDQQLEELLVAHAKKANEGNNGVIYQVEVPLDSEVAQKMGLEASDGSTKKALKCLKVYLPGKGKQEYEMQKRAYDLYVAARERGEDVARVPKPHLFRDLPLTEEGSEFLQADGYTFSKKRVEIIIMEFVEGVDLATHLFREVIKRHPESVHLKDHVEELSFNDLQLEVQRVLRYAKPGGKGKTEEEKIFEAEKIKDENAHLLIKFLEQSGYVLDPRILAQLHNFIGVLHQEQISHGDLHPRNVMIQPEQLGGAENPEVYVVDYGSTHSAETRQFVGDKRLVADDYIELYLGPISRTQSEKRDKEKQQKVKAAQAMKLRVERRPEWSGLMGELEGKDSIDADYVFQKIDRWSIASSPEIKLNILIAFFLELEASDRLDKESLARLIEKKRAQQNYYVSNGLAEVFFLKI